MGAFLLLVVRFDDCTIRRFISFRKRSLLIRLQPSPVSPCDLKLHPLSCQGLEYTEPPRQLQPGAIATGAFFCARRRFEAAPRWLVADAVGRSPGTLRPPGGRLAGLLGKSRPGAPLYRRASPRRGTGHP